MAHNQRGKDHYAHINEGGGGAFPRQRFFHLIEGIFAAAEQLQLLHPSRAVHQLVELTVTGRDHADAVWVAVGQNLILRIDDSYL